MIDVTCAIIRNEENEVLIVQRGEKSDHPFMWEFPGGKVDCCETEEDCILREIREELSIDIIICGRLQPVEHNYGHKQIRLIPFICDTLDELPVLSEHVAFKWLQPCELVDVNFSEADIAVSNNYLKTVNSEKDENFVTAKEDDDKYDGEIRSMIERIQGTKEAEWIASSAVTTPAILRKLLQFSYSGDSKLAFHASWILSKAHDRYPELIHPHIPSIIDNLATLTNESAGRSFLRIISLSEIKELGEKHQGKLADHCFTKLRSRSSAIAIKAYSMEILYKLALIYPGMANELSASIRMITGEGSAGIKARGRMILHKLSEDTKDF